MSRKWLSICMLFCSVGVFGQNNFVYNFLDSYFDGPHSKIKIDMPITEATRILTENGYNGNYTGNNIDICYRNTSQDSYCTFRCTKDNTLEYVQWTGWYDSSYFKTPEEFADCMCEYFNSFGLESWYCFDGKTNSYYHVGFILSPDTYLFVSVYSTQCYCTFTHHSDWKSQNPYETETEAKRIYTLSSNYNGEDVYYKVEKMPQYPEGMRALVNYLESKANEMYPPEAKANKYEGVVIVRCVITKTGAVAQPEIVRSTAQPSLNRAAIQIAQTLPDFIPGEQAGEKMNVYFYIPIQFNSQLF